MKVIAAKLAKDGETPLEFMVRLMRTPLPTQVKGEEELDYLKRCKEHFLTQQDMAKAAAPYIHPRLASTVISGDEDRLAPPDMVRKVQRIRDGRNDGAGGRLVSHPPQAGTTVHHLSSEWVECCLDGHGNGEHRGQ